MTLHHVTSFWNIQTDISYMSFPFLSFYPWHRWTGKQLQAMWKLHPCKMSKVLLIKLASSVVAIQVFETFPSGCLLLLFQLSFPPKAHHLAYWFHNLILAKTDMGSRLGWSHKLLQTAWIAWNPCNSVTIG